MTEIDVTRLSPEAEELQVRANTDLKFAGLTSATTLALSAIGIFLANKAGIDYGSIRYTDQLLAGGATTAALGTYLLSGRHYLRAAWNRLRASRARTDEEASLPPERVSYGTVSEMVRSLPLLANRFKEIWNLNRSQTGYGYKIDNRYLTEYIIDNNQLLTRTTAIGQTGNPRYADAHAPLSFTNGESAVLFSENDTGYGNSNHTIALSTTYDRTGRMLVHPKETKTGRKGFYEALEQTYRVTFENNWHDPLSLLSELVQVAEEGGAGVKNVLGRQGLLFETVDRMAANGEFSDDELASLGVLYQRLTKSVSVTNLVLSSPHIMTTRVLSDEDKVKVHDNLQQLSETMRRDLNALYHQSKETEPNWIYGKYAYVISQPTSRAKRALQQYDALKPRAKHVNTVLSYLEPQAQN